jgi:signal transduction histidine kinase
MSGEMHDMPWLQAASEGEMSRVVEALYRVHRLTAAVTDIDTLLTRISTEAKSVAGAEAASVLLYDPAVGDTGDQDALKREVRLNISQGIAGATARERRSINVEDARHDPRFFSDADAASQFETRSLLATPMIDRDQLVGVLEVVNKLDGTAFTDFDMRVMEMFSSLAAAAVVSARLIDERISNERLAAIGQAVTGLSHYTKNIVTGLVSSADLIDMGLEHNNLKVLQRSWPVFRRSTKRIANFVQDMLTLSRPREPIREDCELFDILHDAHATVAELFAQKKVEVEIHVSKDASPFQADSQGLYRCALNLLSNAADAAPANGGLVALRAFRNPEGGLVIECEDNGPGVPEADRESIFDLFFSTKGSKGTGLGLAVTHKIVQEHGGAIEVTAGALGGALFRLVLPASHVPRQAREFDPLLHG